MEVPDEVLVFAIAHDRANVPRTNEALYPIARGTQERSNRGRHEYVRGEDREVFQSLALGLPDGHGIRRSRRFKTNSEEDHFAAGICASELERFGGRINHAHVSAPGLHMEEISM